MEIINKLLHFLRLKDIKVVDEISRPDRGNRKEACCGWDVSFKDGMRGQKDYFDQVPDAEKIYYDALRKYILENNIKISGDTYQWSRTPVFSDGKIASFSWRSWGCLMAAIWSEEENRDYGYTDFYMREWMGRWADKTTSTKEK